MDINADRIPPTEARNPRTTDLDQVTSAQIVDMLCEEEETAVEAVRQIRHQLADVVETALERTRRGGRIHYFGAGASGRLAGLDAMETTPTFNAPPGLFTAHFPGGVAALVDSSLDFEDAEPLGAEDAGDVQPDDLVIGISASGTTAYVRGALTVAADRGGRTVLITSNSDSPLGELAHAMLVLRTGAEALTGSTRLKSGTATKIALNAFSTALMVRAGHTYSNLMVELVATNAKLRERAVRILMEASGDAREECTAVLDSSDGRVPLALVRLITGYSRAAAGDALARHTSVRAAVDALRERGA